MNSPLRLSFKAGNAASSPVGLLAISRCPEFASFGVFGPSGAGKTARHVGARLWQLPVFRRH